MNNMGYKKIRAIISGGGTGGHIFPAISIADKLKELNPETEILFVGAEGKMEMDLVPRSGYEIRPLKITNISRGRSLSAVLHNLDTVKNVLASQHEAGRVLKEFRPDAVIGTGGYVCFPVLAAAARLHIPTLVHESNALPGLTTRMLADRVDAEAARRQQRPKQEAPRHLEGRTPKYSQPSGASCVGT